LPKNVNQVAGYKLHKPQQVIGYKNNKRTNVLYKYELMCHNPASLLKGDQNG